MENNNTENTENVENITELVAVDAPIKKKKKLSVLRAAVVALIAFTLICGIIYPVSVTLVSQAAFPYEANGSVVTVTMPNGEKRVYGSELIGQEFTDGKYLLGRVNLGSPSNLSPSSDEFKKFVEERMEFLATLGHTTGIPSDLVTRSGSGVDPHISVAAAEYQIARVVEYRNKDVADDAKISASDVSEIVKKYTKGRFLLIFGEKSVNVLLVNLALDGKI